MNFVEIVCIFSSEVEWEAFVEPNGELFYIESPLESFADSKSVENDDSEFPPELTRRRSMRAGKIIRLIKRKSSTRGSMRNKKPNSSEHHRNNHETIQEDYALANYEVMKNDFFQVLYFILILFYFANYLVFFFVIYSFLVCCCFLLILVFSFCFIGRSNIQFYNLGGPKYKTQIW